MPSVMVGSNRDSDSETERPENEEEGEEECEEEGGNPLRSVTERYGP